MFGAEVLGSRLRVQGSKFESVWAGSLGFEVSDADKIPQFLSQVTPTAPQCPGSRISEHGAPSNDGAPLAVLEACRAWFMVLSLWFCGLAGCAVCGRFLCRICLQGDMIGFRLCMWGP